MLEKTFKARAQAASKRVSRSGRAVYPRPLNAEHAERGQATLPDHEILFLESATSKQLSPETYRKEKRGLGTC